MTETLQNAVRFAQTGPINTVLTIESIPKPVNPPGYSLVQVHASAINPSDVLNVEGRFPMTSAPRTPGRDFAGIVVDGPQESIGRRVWGTGGTNGFDRDGSHAEWIVVPSDSLEEMPGNISFAQAAACGVAFLTASMMLNRAATKKGEYVLVLGSSGAVGSAAVQLAHYIGALPVSTSRTKDSSSVNITEDLAPQIEKTTSGKGVSVIIDTVGEATLFKKCIDVLAPNGRYVIITAGKTPGFQFTFNAFDLYRKCAGIFGLNTLAVSFKEAVQELAKLKQGFEDGVLLPPAALEEIDLADTKAALAAYEKVKTGTKAKQILINRNL